MSQVFIADTQQAGNATDTTIFTMPAGYVGFLGSLIASNTTAGSLNLTLKINRNGVSTPILQTSAIAANSSAVYNKGATIPLTQLCFNAGDTLIANASGAGIFVIFGGLRFST